VETRIREAELFAIEKEFLQRQLDDEIAA